MKILLVEDDQGLARLLQTTLEQRQHQVEIVFDGQDGWELATAFPYDLILLDWMLPHLDGIHFCQRLRSRRDATFQPNQDTPVLLMTTLDTITNKIIGLDAGADDYVVKPLDFDELQARIRALGRRGGNQRSPLLEWEGLRLNPHNCEVTYQDQPIALTLKEYQLLELMLRHPNQIFSQSRLIDHIWGQSEIPTENAVRAQVKGLRHKLHQVGAGDTIETVYKLGYRLKKSPLPESSSIDSSPPPSPATLLPDLWQVWLEYRDSYQQRVGIIEASIAQIPAGQLTPPQQQQAEREAHTLIGSLGSFGQDEASRLARQIQQILKQAAPLTSAEWEQLSPLVRSLKQAIMAEPSKANTCSPSVQLAAPTAIATSSPIQSSVPTLLIVDDDRGFADRLAMEAAPWGMHTEIALNLKQARQQILHQLPQVVLLNLSLSEAGESGLDCLTKLQNWYPDLPVLVLTASDRLGDRVQAARLGCKGFLQKPLSPTQVLTMVTQVWQHTQPHRPRLMIVDDDPLLLKLLHHMLTPEGYDLTLLDDPQQFWHVLEQTAPDLLILDVDLQQRATLSPALLTDLNGFDLCQVMRNDPHWCKVPILFLSAQTESNAVQQGFESGADDFLHKPIVPVELLTRIRKRVEQGQMRRQTDIDELTGVSNRRQALQDLTRLLRLAQRQQSDFSLAVLDLDYFKHINDQYGHEMGDRVLHYFGNLLKQSFRQEDVVGRWGGEEFIIGLYGMSKADGIKRLTAVLQTLQRETFTTVDGRAFQVTFSGGITQFTGDGTDLQGLYRAADGALYQAKAQGRNRILATLE